MKYLIELNKLSVFSFVEAQTIIGSFENTKMILRNYIKKGYISKIKKGLYAVKNSYGIGTVASVYEIASHITKNSFVTCHTAFEYYGCYNQVFNVVQVASLYRFKSFEYDRAGYECYCTKTDAQIINKGDYRIPTIERTIVDSIDQLGKCMDVEELFNCIELVESINIEKIKEMLDIYDKEILYAKVGYVLEYFKSKFNIDESFFDYCLNKKSRKSKSEKVSYYEFNKLDYISKWGLYAYKDPINMNKEINVYV